MFIIEEKNELFQKQLIKKTTIFTDFTGIKLHSAQKDFMIHPLCLCVECPHPCPAFSKNTLQYGVAENGRLFFCAAGYCFIALHVKFSSHHAVSLLSFPILCSDALLLTGDLPMIVKPEQIMQAFYLLKALMMHEYRPSLQDLLYDGLSNTVRHCNIEKAQFIIEHALEKFLSQEGHNIDCMKSDCIHLIFTMYQLINAQKGHNDIIAPSKKQLSALICAKSIGELKSCVDEAGKLFMNALFHPMICKHHYLIQKVLKIMEENYHLKLSQHVVANTVYLSPSHFSKIFNEATGMSFNQCLNQIRITKAKELLSLPTLCIEQIHSMVGFENRSYFGKVFKAITGTTPKQYRNRIIN